MPKAKEKEFVWEEWIPFFILCLSIPVVAIYYYKFEFIWSKMASSNLSLLVVLLASFPVLMKTKLKNILSLDFSFFLLLSFWAGLSAAWAEVPHKVFKLTMMLDAGVIGFGLAKLVVRDKEKVRWFLVFGAITGIFIACYGILQYHIDSGFFAMPKDQYGEKDPVTTYGLSNFTVDVLVVILPFGIGLFFSKLHSAIRYLGVFSVLAIVYYILVSRVRAGYMAIIVMTLFFSVITIILNRKLLYEYRKQILISISGLIIASVLFFSLTRLGRNVIVTFLSSFNLKHSSVKIRIHAWKQSLKIIRDNPVIGVGLGNYEVVSWKYQDAVQEKMTLESNTRVDRTHNEYLNVTSDLGFIGFFLFMVFFTVLLLKGLFYLKLNSGMKEEFWIVACLMAGVIGELVDAFFTFPFQMPGSIHQFFITAGVLSAVAESDELVVQKDPIKKVLARIPDFFSGILKYTGIVVVLITLVLAFIWDRNFTLSEVNYRIGQLLKRKGRLRDSLIFFERGLKYEPFAERIYYDRAFVLARLGNPRKAAESMANCLKEVPYFGKARKEYALFLSDSGQYDRALEEFSKALPYHQYAAGEIHLYMAAIYLKKRVPQLALEEILKAMRNGARNVKALDILGHSLALAGRKNLGASVMRQAVLISGKDYRAVASYASFFSSLGANNEALKLLYESEEDLKGNANYWFLRSVIEATAGKKKAPKNSLKMAISIDPAIRRKAEITPELKDILKTIE